MRLALLQKVISLETLLRECLPLPHSTQNPEAQTLKQVQVSRQTRRQISLMPGYYPKS